MSARASKRPALVTTTAHGVLAALLLLVMSQPATAQLGGLRRRLEKAVAGKVEGDAPKPGGARATAILEWTIESVLTAGGECVHDANGDAKECALGTFVFPATSKAKGNGASTPATLTDKEHGRLTVELDFDDPNALPGGMIGRMSGGPLYPIGVVTGAPMGAYRVASFSGGVSFNRQARPTGACNRLGADAGNLAGHWNDPVTIDASGRSEYAKENVVLQLAFKGETPVSFDFSRPSTGLGKAMGVSVTGRGSYACGSSFTVRDTVNGAGFGLNVRDGVDGWTVRTERTTGGYTMTARKEETEKGTDNSLQARSRRVVHVATLTWTAPAAPEQSAAAPTAAVPTFETGKGSITFTQKGKQVTWPLQSVSDVNQAGVTSGTFMFTPDGGTPSDERGLLALSITKVMGQTMTGLNLQKGPAGDAAFEAEECTAQVKPATGKASSGSGECRKGAMVVTFTFTVVR